MTEQDVGPIDTTVIVWRDLARVSAFWSTWSIRGSFESST